MVWAAEAWGSDVVSVLGFLAARTSRIDIGSAIMQIPARTPAMTAMTAATLDTLSGGRFRLGLGVSGPQVSEGWHGVRFDKPLGRTREYVEIVRTALRRETLAYQGEHYTLPLPGRPGQGAEDDHPSGARARCRSTWPRSGRRTSSWPARSPTARCRCSCPPSGPATTSTRCGPGARKAGRSLDGFDVAPTVPLSIGPDPRACADPVRGYAALYVGGMGSREQNFYNHIARRMGFEAQAREVQDLYLDRKQREAAAAVPYEFVDRTSLLGPPERIADRLAELAAAGVTTVASRRTGDARGPGESLRVLVGAVERAGLA